MNCEKCLALLNNFIDGELSAIESAALTAHLEKCSFCNVIKTDLSVIINSCEEVSTHLEEPPNSQALWLRISNLIECERSPLTFVEPKVAAVNVNTNWWTKTMERSWQLSFQQMVSAVLGVAVIASLLTVVGLQNVSRSAGLFDQSNPASSAQNNLLKQFLQNPENADNFQRLEIENRLKQQQLAIQYWNQRVETRKNQWNRNLRDAFDRNLHEIDQVVADYKQQLQNNPQDKISEEMLDSALKDKMDLLREFSEL
jgi:hypothetical protein